MLQETIRFNLNAARYIVSLSVFDLRLASLYFRLKPICHHQAGKFSVSQFNQITKDVKSSKQKWKLLNGLVEKGWAENLANGWYRIKSQQRIGNFRGRKFVQLNLDIIESLKCMDISTLKAICLELITTQQNAKQRKVAKGYIMTNSRGEREKVRGNRKVLEYDGLTSLFMQANYLGCSTTEIKRLRQKQKLAAYFSRKPILVRFSRNQYEREMMQTIFDNFYKNRTENNGIKGKFFLFNNCIYFCSISLRDSFFSVKRR